MTIRNKLSILFVLITAGILLVFAAIIYVSSKQNREKEFYSLLRKEAITKANLFFDAQVAPETLQDIYRRNRAVINEVEVAIYDQDFNLLYHDALDIDFVKETREMNDQIFKHGAIQFYQEEWQVIGLRFHYNGKEYAVTAAAYDDYGYTKLLNLKQTILLVFIISILFIYLSGRFFLSKAFTPIRQMIRQAKSITATNLDLRLHPRGTKDELSELAITFNEMLNRLENSFKSQSHFVSKISHELRTPLTAIIAELEISANAPREIEEYQKIIQNILHDAHKMNRLSTSLLDLAKAGYDSTRINFKPVRIDELIIDARQQVQKANPDYAIDIRFEQDFEDENQIIVTGNAYLLKVAFANLFENGCKFSADKKCTASITIISGKIEIQFTDEGIGISPDDMAHLFTPFYRGLNATKTEGNGIGLSLTKKIVTLHKGDINVQSEPMKGSKFTITLNHH